MGSAILHAFNWTFDEITTQLPEIKELGYSAVLTSPISYSHGNDWWMRYQPLDFRLICSPLGDKMSFLAMIEKARGLDIKIYVDIVINHMAHRNADEPLDYPGNKELENYKSNKNIQMSKIYGDITQNQFSSNDFNPRQIIQNYSNVDEIRNFRIQDERVPNGLPDFAINKWVIAQQKEYLHALIKIGVSGFRIDAAKHVPVEHINGIIDDSIQSSAYVFAEVIPDQDYVIMREVIHETSIALYDFPLFYQIREAFKWGGSFKTLEQFENNHLLSKDRSVTFVNTHDIPNNDSMKNQLFELMEDEMLAYAYIFGRNGGCPLLFTDKGDNLNSVNSYDNRWKDLYKNPEIIKMLHFHNQTHGSEMKFVYVDDGIMVCERVSKGFFVINKTVHPFEYEINFNKLNGNFFDLFSNQKLFVKDNKCLVNMAARCVRMWLRS